MAQRRGGAEVEAGPTVGVGWLMAVTRALLPHPRLWWTAMRQAVVLASPGWWRRRPWLPVPDADYLHFRMVTAYGRDVAPDPADVVVYLDWCRRWPAASGGR